MNIQFHKIFKSFFVVAILLLIFFSVNLMITIKNKPQSAYNYLSSEQKQSTLKLQDTRVHNWSEISDKEKK